MGSEESTVGLEQKPRCSECEDTLEPEDSSYAYEHRIVCHDCYGDLNGWS